MIHLMLMENKNLSELLEKYFELKFYFDKLLIYLLDEHLHFELFRFHSISNSKWANYDDQLNEFYHHVHFQFHRKYLFIFKI